MIIRNYLVKDVNEGMQRARIELGNNAVIISQKKVKRPGIAGFFGRKLLEVTAVSESSENNSGKNYENNSNDYSQNYNMKQKNEDEEFRESLESIKKLMENELVSAKLEKNMSGISQRIQKHNEEARKNTIKSAYEKKLDSIEDSYQEKIKRDSYSKDQAKNLNSYVSMQDVHNEMKELKDMLKNAMPKNQNEEEKSNLKQQLRDMDIDEEFFEHIEKDYKTGMAKGIEDKEILRDIFERDVLVTNKEFKGRVVLVGPTGVGKTTTIAKLAGRLALKEKKKVGLITIDTYRIGAVEQLKTYGEIMNIPFRVVMTIKEMEEAIKEMEDCDVILIDTTGRSSKNAMQISELRAFLQKADPDSVNMVISSITKNKDLKTILESYSILGYESIIVTKLDETTSYGSLYNIAKRSNKPISFITTGQNVPDDIRASSKEEIAQFILGEETLC